VVSRNEQQSDHPGPEPEDEAVSAFVERFAGDLTEAGLQRMASRVFACLLASDSGALSSAELADRLQVSPAAISGAVRYLGQVHMVSRERLPGSRRERYRVHADIWYEAITNREAIISRWLNTLKTGVDAVGRETPAGQRLTETAAFFEFMRAESAFLMERWHRHRLERFGPPSPGDGPSADDH
jgi:DNA-binding transcriptional regulator GbsR (MarR family)